MEGHLAALVNVSTDEEAGPLYYFLGGDAAHHINLINYEDPAPIGVFKAKHNEISPLRKSDPESLQSMDADLREWRRISDHSFVWVHDALTSSHLLIYTEISKKTLALMACQDHEKNINVLLAHDETLEAVLEKLSGSKKAEFVRLKGTKEEFELFKTRKRKDKGEA